ncbi:hypothetical protein ACLOJK_033807 [Asimina triloba]
MAPRRSARIVRVTRKETRITGEDDQVSVKESSAKLEAVAVGKRTTTPPKVVRVLPVEESEKKKTRKEKAKEDGVEQTRTQAAAAAAAEAEGEQKGEKMRKEASETGAAKEAEQKGEKKIRKKKKMKRRGSGGGGGGYRRYVFRVLKQVHPELRVSSMAMAVLNGFMNDMFEKIVGEAAQLSKYSGRMTLSAKEIQGAVRLVLPGELGKHAVAEGTKAVTNYYSTVIVKPPS